MRRVPLTLFLLLAAPLAGGPVHAAGEPTVYLLALDTWPAHPALVRSLAAAEVAVLERFDVANALLVRAPAGAVPLLAALPTVARAVPDEHLDMLLDSSRLASGLTEDVYRSGATGSGVTIALVDAGIDERHPGLTPNLLLDLHIGPSGDPEDGSASVLHGTHVAGVLVGTGDGAPRGRNLAGVAPEADLVALDLSSQFTTSNAVRAFEWIYDHHAEHGIRVVANSWGRQRDVASYDTGDPILRASNALVARGLVVVFSAGNGGDLPGRMTLEATNPSVITVGAASDAGRVESYSSRGPILDGDREAAWTKPDLVAPGSRVISTRAGGTPGALYVMMNGTSMAAPHVAGAAALLLSAEPSLTPGQVKAILTQSARDVGASGVDDESGHGMLDVSRALELVRSAEPQAEERRSVLEREGQLSGPSQVTQLLGSAKLDGSDAIDFDVPANATRADLLVNWSGTGQLRARLIGPDGSVSTFASSASRRYQLIAPEPGPWRLVVEPDGVGSGNYETRIALQWMELRPGAPLPEDAVATGPRGFPAPASLKAPSFIPGLPWYVPLAASAALTLLVVAGRMRKRSRVATRQPEAWAHR